MKKILFVINTMGQAGAEKAMAELMRILDPREYEICLYALINRGEVFEELPDYVRVLNRKPDSGSVLDKGGKRKVLMTVLKNGLNRGTVFTMLPYLIRNFIQQKKRGRVLFDKLFWKLISKGARRFPEEYDLAIAYLEGGATYYVADHVKAVKKAAFVHIDYQEAGYTPLIDDGAYEKIDRIFTVSKEVGEKFLQVYPSYQDKVFLFRNIINTKWIWERSGQEGFTDSYQGIRLLTIGRLHYQKAYDVAVFVLKRLLEDGYQVKWYVLGEGDERPKIEKLIRENGLEDRFILMGAVSNPYPYLRQADIYVHATRFEGKSIAIEEAQTLHKPIVASNCTGNREQIRSGVDGILVELEEKAVAEAIEQLIDQPQMREGLIQEVAKKELRFEEDLKGLLELTEGQNI